MELLLVKPRVKSISFDEVNFVEKFEISPLEAGQARGVFGNALRTTLMSNIPGYAITNFKVGSKRAGDSDFAMKSHIFDTIPGVTTDVVELSLRLKESNFRLKNMKEKELTTTKVGPCIVTVGDFADGDVVVLNPDKELFEIIDDTEITMTIRVQEGRGYKDESAFDEESWIAIDGLFSPVTKVSVDVEPVRVNGVEGFEKLIIVVSTNGKLMPKEALDTAIRIINEGYSILREGAQDVIDNEAIYFDVQEEEKKTTTFKNLTELGLSARAYNALKAFGINNSGDFEKYTEKQIREINNLGKKSLLEIKDKLVELNIDLKKS